VVHGGKRGGSWPWHGVGQRQPRDSGVGSRTGEAGEEREGRERGGRLAGGPAHGVGPAAERKGGRSHYMWSGPEGRAQLARKEREKGRLPCGACGV
jgi:hypothetical protein